MTFPSGAEGFQNPILGGSGALIRVVMHSKNYVAGVSGWAIFSNGNCEFNTGTFRGTIVVGSASGNRIEINQVSGVINMFNAANQITGSWDSNNQRFILYKAGTSTSYIMLTTGSLVQMLLNPNGTVYTADASIQTEVTAIGGGTGRLALYSPSPSGQEQMTFRLNGGSVDGTVLPYAELFSGSLARQTGAIRVDGAWNQLTLAAGFQSADVLANSVPPAYRFITPNRVGMRGAWQPNPAGSIVSPSTFAALPAAITPAGVIRYFATGTSLTATTVNGRTSVRGTSSNMQFNFVGATAPTWASLDGIEYDIN